MSGFEGNRVFFNQLCTSLCLATEEEVKVYDVTDVDERALLLYKIEIKDVTIVERVLDSPLFFLVTENKPRCLFIYRHNGMNDPVEHTFSHKILAVKANPVNHVVCTDEFLYVYEHGDYPVIKNTMMSDKETGQNKRVVIQQGNSKGIFAISPDIEHGQNLIVYQCETNSGTICIFDIGKKASRLRIAAHDTELAAIAFSYDGRQVVTASEKGTLLRVFCTFTGAKLHEFRRGTSNAKISCLALTSDYLCCSSEKETIHVFKLNPDSGSLNVRQTTTTAINVAERIFGAFGGRQMVEKVAQDRKFAYINQTMSHRHIVGIAKIFEKDRILVAGNDACLRSYQIPKYGGECKQVQSHCLGNFEIVREDDGFQNITETSSENSEMFHSTWSSSRFSY